MPALGDLSRDVLFIIDDYAHTLTLSHSCRKLWEHLQMRSIQFNQGCSSADWWNFPQQHTNLVTNLRLTTPAWFEIETDEQGDNDERSNKLPTFKHLRSLQLELSSNSNDTNGAEGDVEWLKETLLMPSMASLERIYLELYGLDDEEQDGEDEEDGSDGERPPTQGDRHVATLLAGFRPTKATHFYLQLPSQTGDKQMNNSAVILRILSAAQSTLQVLSLQFSNEHDTSLKQLAEAGLELPQLASLSLDFDYLEVSAHILSVLLFGGLLKAAPVVQFVSVSVQNFKADATQQQELVQEFLTNTPQLQLKFDTTPPLCEEARQALAKLL
eukprot:TRINITY_DN60464_c0_g1_i2.p1 TRINITY_DN60464_c0_g1~~TRINITY_DN60464_c0_g1_i2.p1  ORF type:complete len:328 (-),score=57.31 TRINITY_DN60464_c0_g1_i2:429-1412(-)